MKSNNVFEPATLDDFVFGNSNTEEILRGILQKRIVVPSGGTTGLLLYGAFGTGKTTLAKLLPELIEQHVGGDNSNVGLGTFISCEQGKRGSEIMQRINKVAKNCPAFSSVGIHYYVLDEVDNLATVTQRSLKAVMNKTTSLFILTTNFITSIDKSIKDRCCCPAPQK